MTRLFNIETGELIGDVTEQLSPPNLDAPYPKRDFQKNCFDVVVNSDGKFIRGALAIYYHLLTAHYATPKDSISSMVKEMESANNLDLAFFQESSLELTSRDDISKTSMHAIGADHLAQIWSSNDQLGTLVKKTSDYIHLGERLSRALAGIFTPLDDQFSQVGKPPLFETDAQTLEEFDKLNKKESFVLETSSFSLKGRSPVQRGRLKLVKG